MIWSILILSFGLTLASENVTPEYLTQLRAAGHDEEFARLLGIENVNFVRRNTDERDEFINKPVSPLGDIMLTKEQMEQARQNLDFTVYPHMKWPKNYIPYVIQKGDFTPEQEALIHQSIEEMNLLLTHIKILKRFEYVPQEYYVLIINGNGCWSYLGCHNNVQAMSLQSNGCLYKSTIKHEFMHAIGFTHEQNRYDRNNYIKMLWNNIPEEWKSQFQQVDEKSFQHIHPYDYYSIMHYPKTARGTYENAFRVRQSGINENLIGNVPDLSEIDVKKIDDVYQGCD